MMPNLLGWGLTMAETLLILVVALLLFGKRLPEVARSMGKSVVEFKKGMSEVTDSLTDAAQDAQKPVAPAAGAPTPAASVATSAPVAPGAEAFKFDPYTGKPIQETQAKS